MPRLNDPKKLKRFHAVIYEEDYQFLKTVFGPTNISEGLRKILHKSINVLRDQSARGVAKSIHPLDEDAL